jgi:cyanophycinase
MGSRTFLLMGSGEFEPWSFELERAALRRADGDGSVAILPTASAPDGDGVFDRWSAMGLDHYRGIGVRAEVLDVRRREDAMRPEVAARAESASMVFFSGGKPQHLASVLVGSLLWEAIGRALDRGAIYAGCSAGAMVASQSRTRRTEAGSLGSSWVFGMGLVPNVSFGVHWDRMRFIPGVRPFVMSRLSPGQWFVGIDERTAILGDGTAWEVHGRGEVTVRHERGTTTHRSGERFVTRGGDDPEANGGVDPSGGGR